MTIEPPRLLVPALTVLTVLFANQLLPAQDAADQGDRTTAAAAEESAFLSGTRQLTFEGRRAGEGYFSRDGRRMVFQSEREPGNPFFQIYLLDFETGDIQRVSPGSGKTTCAWIHPVANQVLLASTHEDAAAKQKQEDEIATREAGKERRYSWDYDENYDIFRYDVESRKYDNLTRTRGYDAEGSWSPDGSKIAFASNRRAYTAKMTDREKERFNIDPAYMIDLYIMDADGSNLRRLTDSPGYDGGPFFSPDGKRLCWRRFSTDGATAEIMTMKVDGTDQRQITSLGAMSWAPFYHPSGDYLIFTTNRHGFANFELYIVDAEAKSEPVRITHTDGFDGLPVFTPNGKQLAWTSNRTSNKQSQIFLANWNDQAARRALGLSDEKDAALAATSTESANVAARESAALTHADFSPQDILRHVDYLCRPELEGRRTGTDGGRLATAYVAAYFENLGLTPAGDDGGWFQEFEFAAGVDLGAENRLTWNDTELEVNRQWRPLAFSATGEVAPANVVFGGYGLSMPEKNGQAGYDSFVHLDVTDKWLLVFRFVPENITPERRQQLTAHSSLRYKAMVARDKGARGLILVSGPNSQVREPLVKLGFDGAQSGSSIPVISVTDDVAAAWLATADKDLKSLQDELDAGDPTIGFALPDVVLTAQLDIRTIKQRGRNVLGRLTVGDFPTAEQVVIGAHIDHLGRGGGGSLARDDEASQIHFGADDNASGVAAMLEIAQNLATRKSAGRFSPKRDVLFAAWSGEEVGLLGSAHFAKQLAITEQHGNPHPHPQPVDDDQQESHGGHAPGTLYPNIAACLNMDMVGRLDKRLILQGIGSSSIWKSEIERRNAVVGLPVHLQNDCYLPTDASTFFMRGVPILSAFTGTHSEYHTPRDTPDKLNYEGAASTARLMALIARSLTTRDDPPDFVPQSGPEQPRRARLRAYLGTIPDYAETDVKGVMLSGVSKDGPAAKAGIQAGDIVTKLAGRKIENIYDYTYAIEALKIGEEVQVVVKRGGEEKQLKVVPGSRQ